jgi:hypothetical protein
MLISSGMSIFSIVTETLLAIIHDEHFNVFRSQKMDRTKRSNSSSASHHHRLSLHFNKNAKDISSPQHSTGVVISVPWQEQAEEAKFISTRHGTRHVVIKEMILAGGSFTGTNMG